MSIDLNKVNAKIDNLSELMDTNKATSLYTKFSLVNEIADLGYAGLSRLLLLLTHKLHQQQENINVVYEYIYESLLRSQEAKILMLLEHKFPDGFTLLQSDLGVDYKPLEQLLRNRQFQEADHLTQCLLCQLSKITHSHSRSWLYFTDIPSLPSNDLHTIDKLWQIHSLGLFGISVQRDIWLANNSDWEKFWGIIGWTVKQSTLRYPQEFIWSLQAPKGHLPLFNQLRGVQVLDALFNHPVWNEKKS